MKIGYIIWLEDIEGTIIKTQVIDLLSEIKKQNPDYVVDIIYFCQIIKLFKNYRSMRQFSKSLSDLKINVKVIPVFFIPRISNLFFYKWHMALYPLFVSTLSLLCLQWKRGYDIFHYRSYPIVYSGVLLKKIRKKLKIVFDTRSSFPEEGVRLKRWGLNSLSFRMWKKIETKSIESLDSTIVVTSSIKTAFEIKKMNQLSVIPNNVDISMFTMNQKSREYYREQLRISEDCMVFLYSGSLMKNSWNDPENYLPLFDLLDNTGIKYQIVFLTPQVEDVNLFFINKGIDKQKFLAFSVEHKNMSGYLAIADIGINFMQDNDYRLSIKTVEYISMGIPLLVTETMIALQEMIKKYKIGAVLNDNNNIETIIELCQNLTVYKENCLLLRNQFSTTTIAKEYSSIYNKIACVDGS